MNTDFQIAKIYSVYEFNYNLTKYCVYKNDYV